MKYAALLLLFVGGLCMAQDAPKIIIPPKPHALDQIFNAGEPAMPELVIPDDVINDLGLNLAGSIDVQKQLSQDMDAIMDRYILDMIYALDNMDIRRYQDCI
jgi:hypothetical protein